MNKLKMMSRILLPIAGGSFIARFATSNAREDYSEYQQPPLSPPGYVFPIVWSGLYLTMGTAYHLARESSDNPAIPISHYTQLGLNFIWSILYFKYKLRGSALIESFALLSAVLLTGMQFYKVNNTAGRMMIPYAAWCAFASYLNAGNWGLIEITKTIQLYNGGSVEYPDFYQDFFYSFLFNAIISVKNNGGDRYGCFWFAS